MKAVFRVDASLQIGSGHVMRCLALARALQAAGADIEFICRAHAGNLNGLIRGAGFVVHELPVAPTQHPAASSSADSRALYAPSLGVSQQQDAEEVVGRLQGERPDWLIVDHYAIDQAWESQLRRHVPKIMVIDDLADRVHDCDVLLDQNFSLHSASRYDGLVAPECTRLLGPEYSLLREEFALARRSLAPRTGPVRRVFVLFGGNDPANVTGRALEVLSAPELSDLEVDVVLGAGNPHSGDIERQVAARPRTALHVQVQNVAELMMRADIAVGAGGSTTWERLFFGLSTLVVTIAENQVPSTKDLDQAGFVRWLGTSETVGVPELREALSRARENNGESGKGMDLVRGDGAARVAGLLRRGISRQEWVARAATASDCELYWHWANDPEVRKNAFQSDPIRWEDHQRWFHRKLGDPDTTLILIDSQRGPIGQVRFDRSAEELVISYSIGRQFRGVGLGESLLSCAIDAIGGAQPLTLIGDVKVENLASARVFEKLLFSEDPRPEPNVRRFRLRVAPTAVRE